MLTANTVEVMYSTDGASWTVAPATAVPDPAGAKKTYQIPKDASVAVNSGSTTTWTAGVMTQDGLTVDVTNTQLTFKMPKSATLSGTPAGTLVRFTAAPGVTLTWTDNAGTTAKTPTTETLADGSTVYFVTGGGSGDKWTANVDVINVSDAETKSGTIINAGTSTAANNVLFVAPAKALTLAQGATASYMKGTTDTSVTSTNGVVPGTMLKIGVGTQTAVTIGTVGNDMVTGTAYSYAMPNAATTLTGGFKVTLEGGVTATVNGEAVTSGKVVTVLNQNLVANAPAGMTVIPKTSAPATKTVYTAANISADVSLTAAYKLTLDKVTVSYVGNSGIATAVTNNTTDTAAYVLPGETITLQGTDQLIITETDGGAAVTVPPEDLDAGQNWARVTVNKALSVDGEA